VLLQFKNSKEQGFYEDFKTLQKAYNKILSKKIIQIINELKAAVSLNDIAMNPSANLHKLSGNYKEHYSINLSKNYVLIIYPLNAKKTSLLNINNVLICEVTDYH